MVGLVALWLPIVVSAVFVFVALSVVHMLPGWHKGDMTGLPGEAKVMDTLRGLNVRPGDYRFPFSNSTKEMQTKEWDAKMTVGPVGVLTIQPSGPLPFGRMMGQWFVYALVIAVFAAYVTGRTRGAGAEYLEVFRVSGAVTFCCYAMAHWQHWIFWGKSTRFTMTHTVDAIFYALVTGATFGWLWPR